MEVAAEDGTVVRLPSGRARVGPARDVLVTRPDGYVLRAMST